MMRIRIEEDQYKIIIDLLKSINIVKISGGGGGGGGSGRNALNKKKKGFFSCFACFKAV
jgi:mevalonate kinase